MKCCSCRILAAIVLGGVFAGQLFGQRVGEIREVDGPTYDLEARWNDDKKETIPWQLDPGWALLSYDNHELVNRGPVATMSVAYLQAEGVFVAESEMRSSYDSVIDAFATDGQSFYAAYLKEKRDRHLRYKSQYNSSHRALAVTVEAAGSGNILDQVGAHIRGNLTLKIIYIGDDKESFASDMAQERNRLQSPPPSDVQNGKNLKLGRVSLRFFTKRVRSIFVQGPASEKHEVYSITYRIDGRPPVTRQWFSTNGACSYRADDKRVVAEIKMKNGNTRRIESEISEVPKLF